MSQQATNVVKAPADSATDPAVEITVKLPTVLRNAAGGTSTVRASGATVGQVFKSLTAEFPDLEERLLTDEGRLHRHLNVFLNDDDVRYIGAMDARVNPGDEIVLMPAVAGG